MNNHDVTLDDCPSQKQFLESIFNSAGDPIIAIGFDRQILWMNQAAQQLTQASFDAVTDPIRNTCHWFYHGQEQACGSDTPCLLDIVCKNGGETKSRQEHKTADGSTRVFEMMTTLLRDSTGLAMGIVQCLRDITEHQNNLALLNEKENALKLLMQRDALTGLANRTLAMERINYALRQANRSGNMVGLIYIDLVGFKYINDSMGHEVGDLVLKRVAQRLTAVVRDCDTVARLGGDEFIVVLDRLKSPNDAGNVANKLIEALREPIALHSKVFNVGGSFGISLYPTDGEDAETLLRHADQAMYNAKRNGSIEAHYATQPKQEPKTCQRQGNDKLKLALEKATEQDFLLFYQPVVDLADNQIIKVEALLRWNSTEMGLLTPDCFLDIAEKSGLIRALDDWVLFSVCQQYMEWQQQGFRLPCISVNLSGKQLAHSELPGRLARILEATGCPADALELELSELSVMTDPEHTRCVLEKLQDLGVSLSLDDFGAGYTSLNHLKMLPISHLKLDRSLVLQLPGNGRDAGVARALMALGQSMKMKIVAKGIETEGQRDFLRAEGCDHGQGYFYSKPMSSDDIALQLVH